MKSAALASEDAVLRLRRTSAHLLAVAAKLDAEANALERDTNSAAHSARANAGTSWDSVSP